MSMTGFAVSASLRRLQGPEWCEAWLALGACRPWALAGGPSALRMRMYFSLGRKRPSGKHPGCFPHHACSRQPAWRWVLCVGMESGWAGVPPSEAVIHGSPLSFSGQLGSRGLCRSAPKARVNTEARKTEHVGCHIGEALPCRLAVAGNRSALVICASLSRWFGRTWHEVSPSWIPWESWPTSLAN